MPSSLGTTCLEVLVKISVQAAVLAALVWLVTRVARRAPAAWRNALWMVVVVKFLVPPFAYYPSELAFWRPPVSQAANVESQEGDVAAHIAAVSEPVANAGPSAESYPEDAVPRATASSVEPTPAARSVFTAGAILPCAWLMGVVVMLALLALRLARQVRLVREASAAPTELVDLLRDAAMCLAVKRRPDLRVSRDARTPMLVGCLRPVVLLPKGITDRCRASDLKAMLLHEVAHVKRRDMAAMWLQQLAQIVFYFHPAVWLAGREIRRERELACDELVLSKSAIPAKDYAAGYVSALKLADGIPGLSASLAMAEPLDMEKRRLTMILRSAIPRPSARWTAALAVIAAVGLPTFAGLAAKQTESAADLLAHVTEARAKALAAVKSAKGSLVYSEQSSHRSDHKPREQPMPGRVAFSGERFAISLMLPYGVEQEIICDGRILRRTTSSPADRPQDYDVRSDTGQFLAFNSRRLFDVVDRAYPNLEKVLLYHKGAPRIVGRETIDGSECVVVESMQAFPQKDGKTHVDTRRLWIDPARGYAVPKLQVWSEGGEFRQKAILSETNVQLSQYDGIWGPARYAHEEYRSDPKTGKRYLSAREVVTYGRDFALNVPVSDSDLKLPLMPGRSVPVDVSQTRELQDARILAGLTAVEGPGVTVTLRDSPKLDPKKKHPDVRANYTVHDTDVRNLVNELFAAGAEAVSVNGQRIVATSSIRCVGPVIMVNSVQVVPPYVIRAIGKADDLEKVLTLPGGVADALLLLDMVQITKETAITVPAYKGKTRFDLARPAADVTSRG